MNKPTFRAWDKINKEMCDVWELDLKSDIEEVLLSDEWDGAWANLKDIILMQSTGLKDENGVEIFEGDFIKFKHNQMSGRGFVYWNKEIGQWWIKDTREATKKRGQRYYPFWKDCKYTIYGNIHANPELLNEVSG